ncbi:MAG: hypothetical protein K2X66_01145 [Cyanobacteria bacterium]|nr:hypothetical protein [Cyanobacteriota bacterium]
MVSPLPALPRTPIKPSNGLGSMIKSFASSLNNSFSYSFQNPSGTISTEKLLEVKIAPLMLPLLALGLILYSMGEDKRFHESEPKKKWAGILAECGLATLLINNTRGIYPLLSVFKGLFEAGQESSTLSKIQVFTSNLLTFMVGFVGVHFGTGMFVEPAIEREEHTIAKVVSDQKFIDVFNNSAKPDMKALGKVFEDFSRVSKDLQTTLQSTTGVDFEVVKSLKQELAVLKESAYSKILPLIENNEIKLAFPTGGNLTKGMEVLLRRLETSQEPLVQLGRKITPMCSYFLATALIGLPLSRYVSRKLAQWMPDAKKNKLPRAPMPRNTLISGDIDPFGIFNANKHGNGHSSVKSGH